MSVFLFKNVHIIPILFMEMGIQAWEYFWLTTTMWSSPTGAVTSDQLQVPRTRGLALAAHRQTLQQYSEGELILFSCQEMQGSCCSSQVMQRIRRKCG